MQPLPERYYPERYYYDRLKLEFETWWREKKGRGEPKPDAICRLTADFHGVNGQWLAPDLVHVARHEYEFWSRAQIEVTAVEFKPRLSELCISDASEALAQRRGAHKAILVVFDDRGSEPSRKGRPAEAVQRDVEEIARGEGLGFIVVSKRDESDSWRWVERVRARRLRPKARWLSRLLRSSFKGKPEEAELLRLMMEPSSTSFQKQYEKVVNRLPGGEGIAGGKRSTPQPLPFRHTGS